MTDTKSATWQLFVLVTSNILENHKAENYQKLRGSIKYAPNFIKMQLNKMPCNLQQPLNGQGVQRISGYKFKNKKKTQIKIRLGTWNISSLCGRGTEVAEKLRKKKVDIYGLQEIQWKNQRACFTGVKESYFFKFLSLYLSS